MFDLEWENEKYSELKSYPSIGLSLCFCINLDVRRLTNILCVLLQPSSGRG